MSQKPTFRIGMSLIVKTVVAFSLFPFCKAFSVFSVSLSVTFHQSSSCYSKGRNDDEYNEIGEKEDWDDNEGTEVVNGEDWRTFRARLVSKEVPMTENSVLFDEECILEKNSKHSECETRYIFDSGLTIEQGTIILNRPPIVSEGEPGVDFGYGLGRQFLHKSVILILEHSNEEKMIPTRGVILNRPTDLKLYDRSSEENTIENDLEESHPSEIEWAIRYGGEESGIHTEHPKFYCLHSFLPTVQNSSRQIMPGIYFTSFKNAQKAVHKGVANSNDFWVFSGFVSWENGELEEEIEDLIWYAISTDSSTIKKGLRILNAGNNADIEESGVRTWSMLMTMFRKLEMLESGHKDVKLAFNDLMLKAWSKKNLVFDDPPEFLRTRELSQEKRLNDELVPGTIIRSLIKNTPFLLSDQQYHKSLILILQNDDTSTGVLLNHPSSRSFEMRFKDKFSFFQNESSVCFPLRFGGPYGGPINIDDSMVTNQPAFFLHMNNELKEKKVGQPVGETVPDGIWKCSMEEASEAIAMGVGASEDFLVIDGVCIWSKSRDTEGSKGL